MSSRYTHGVTANQVYIDIIPGHAMPQILYKILMLIIILTNYQKCPVPLTMWFYPRMVVLFYSLSKVQGKHMSNKENCSVNEA